MSHGMQIFKLRGANDLWRGCSGGCTSGTSGSRGSTNSSLSPGSARLVVKSDDAVQWIAGGVEDLVEGIAARHRCGSASGLELDAAFIVIIRFITI